MRIIAICSRSSNPKLVVIAARSILYYDHLHADTFNRIATFVNDIFVTYTQIITMFFCDIASFLCDK